MVGMHGWNAWLECMVGMHGWNAWLEYMVDFVFTFTSKSVLV